MNVEHQLDDEAVEVRTIDYGDRSELVADFGPSAHSAVDVVDNTVIVVVDGEQHEIGVAGDAQAFMTNGVLTIEVYE
jgi:hypothetical protein